MNHTYLDDAAVTAALQAQQGSAGTCGDTVTQLHQVLATVPGCWDGESATVFSDRVQQLLDHALRAQALSQQAAAALSAGVDRGSSASGG